MDVVQKFQLELRARRVASLQAKRPVSGEEGRADLNRAIIQWLESCQRYGVAPPLELIAAAKRQLKVNVDQRNGTRLKKKLEIVTVACALDSSLSNKKLARACGIQPATIRLWKRDPSFELGRAMFEGILARMTASEKDSALKEIDPWLLQVSLSHRPD